MLRKNLPMFRFHFLLGLHSPTVSIWCGRVPSFKSRNMVEWETCLNSGIHIMVLNLI
ncbi:hypothetical protein M758_10G185900 [Ceratodon purpureus]|uniref:Uncharacterized protein n=1 Tax=Ceratodon purpureus TaxID=3225 RepID=A0A8T0GNH0_CERPU|nr:hypothetical protein KC19_10G190500 [Ceratodon purpureus]KAG0604635.1 hypothetical protein M758_10G185900 [Ceratodon purpureus]